MNNGIVAEMIADSVSEEGVRLCTFQLKYHRYIHGEIMTHRVFSRNASSSRAIPVKKMRSQVWNDPAMPIHWGANQAGMQAKAELTGFKLKLARGTWKLAGKAACGFSWVFEKVGLHKQVANRILEPWQFIHVVLTATDFDNFFSLRDHPDAQPEIRDLAIKMRDAMRESIPVWRIGGGTDGWHLPYVSETERIFVNLEVLKKFSSARCARVSYLTHDNKYPDANKDIQLHDALVGSAPIHASPTEHQAVSIPAYARSGTLRGWQQYRIEVEEKILSDSE